MPTSHLYQISDIIEIIFLTQPKSVLDVGVGFGKYGMLAREYLELWDGRNQYNDWQYRIDGIEAYPQYISPIHDYVYDHIYIGDAVEIIPALTIQYDLILMVDVLEHFTRDNGEAILRACREKSKNTLISTPAKVYSQEGFENPYQRHLSQWTKDDFRQFTPKCFVPSPISLICFWGSESEVVCTHFNSTKQRIKRNFPFLYHPLQLVKRRLHNHLNLKSSI